MAQRAQNNQTSVSLKGHNITEGQVLPKTVSRVLRWRQTKGKIGKANVSYLKQCNLKLTGKRNGPMASF